MPGKFLLVKLKLSLDSPEDLFLPFVVGRGSLLEGLGYGAASGLLIGFIIGEIANSNKHDLGQIIEGIREERKLNTNSE